MDFTTVLCDQFHLQPWQVNNVIQLLDEGNTIPFIARYRKEAHGTLDDQVIRELSERLDYLRNLQKKKRGGRRGHRRPGSYDRGAPGRPGRRRHAGEGRGHLPALPA